MSGLPNVAIIVPTFQRPAHLERTLASLDAQQDCPRFEVIVADDGSSDETEEIVRRHAATASYRVAWVTHPHDGFQLAKCRNEGVAASRAEYLVFVDGDCILPPVFVREHWRRRQKGVVLTGDVVRLPQPQSERVTASAIRDRQWMSVVPRSEYRRLRWAYAKGIFYRLTRHRKKPRLFGGANSMHRCDYEKVNGYDENFRGWGMEDDDLRERLVRSGVRIHCTPAHLAPVHLWHPPSDTTPSQWWQGANIDYYLRRGKLTRCVRGLTKRQRRDVRVRLRGWASTPLRQHILPDGYDYVPADTTCDVDVEIALFPAVPNDCDAADCRILVMLAPANVVSPSLSGDADYVVTPPSDRTALRSWDVRRELAAILDSACGFCTRDEADTGKPTERAA